MVNDLIPDGNVQRGGDARFYLSVPYRGVLGLSADLCSLAHLAFVSCHRAAPGSTCWYDTLEQKEGWGERVRIPFLQGNVWCHFAASSLSPHRVHLFIFTYVSQCYSFITHSCQWSQFGRSQ
jgi:hypothetical protein